MVRMIVAIAALVAVAGAAAWAAGVGPFREEGPSLESVEALVTARLGGGSASCRPLGQGEANGKPQTVYRCRVIGSKRGAYVSACYWIRQDKATRRTILVAEFAC